MVEILHNQDGQMSNETRRKSDVCRLSTSASQVFLKRGQSPKHFQLLRLSLLLFIFVNSITFFLEGVSCNSQPEDFYKLLELTPQASKADIKKAFRRLSKKYHPDKNKGDETAADQFKKINRAYEVLADDEKRQIYNQGGQDDLERYEQ